MRGLSPAIAKRYEDAMNTGINIESLTGTLCGIAISVVTIWYANHLGLVAVGYFVPCDLKDLLLIGGSVVLIVYKKIFPRKNK